MTVAKIRKTGVKVIIGGVVLGLTTSAYAQVTVPTGSPISSDQSSSSSTNSNSQSGSQNGTNNSTNANPYGGSQTISALDVSEKSTTLTLDQSGNKTAVTESPDNTIKKPPLPGEFEKYISELLGRKVMLFGTKLVLPALRDFAAPATATVPPDYIVQPGDTIDIALSGSLDGSVQRVVDTNGKVFLTGVGAVRVAGVRNSDLHDVIAGAIGTKFRGFTTSVTITKLRGIRVYVTGLANNPGAFTVSSLSTLANAVFQAGGPNAGGSWRAIKLYRTGRQIADFDLYQLMRGGSRVNDVQLQNEDVLFIPPAGPEVAVIGSVQEEAIYEARPEESIAGMLAAAGGPNTVGDPAHFVLYRANDPTKLGPQRLDNALASSIPIAGGDIIQVMSTGTLTMPIATQKVLVRIEGEVQKPGIYYVAPGTPTSEVIAEAGGLTTRAYPFGTKFTRQSVQIQQQESFKEALNQLEFSLSAAPLSQDPTLPGGDRTTQLAAARAVVARLREAKPDGRVVLDIAPNATTLPGSILLENNDSIMVPPLASTVGVFGAVYRPTSFLIDADHQAKRVRDYIDDAGGNLRAADKGGIFVVRANGEVIPKKRGALNMTVLPGDVIFVPVRTEPNLFWARFSAIATTLFGIGLSAATVVAVTR